VESVRYERARIARELHDIVAHCLSVMVVQASAGQRMPPADRDGVAEALESVAEAAAQAQTEVGRLVELLSGDLPAGGPPGLPMVDELVRRASGTGLAVTCRFAGSCDRLAPAASQAAYRVVQEALTNALKHAPGAPVDITIRGQDTGVALDVVNAAPRHQPCGLERSGGGFGLAGMRDRVAACGGRLTSCPTPAGGWRVSAVLPAGLGSLPAVVTRGWRPGEFWRVGPGQNGWVGQNGTRPPPCMRWRGPCLTGPCLAGPCQVAPSHFAQPSGIGPSPGLGSSALPGASAGHPRQAPVSRLLLRPRSFLRVVPVSGSGVFLLLGRGAPQELPGNHFYSFPGPHDIHRMHAVIRT